MLLKYLAGHAAMHCFRPCDSESKRRGAAHAARVVPLSCGTKPGDRRTQKPRRAAGESYTSASYRRAVERACDKAKVERWTPNRLRRTAGTEIRRKYGVEASRVCLGHTKLSTTELYSERDYALAARVAREVG